MQFPFWKHISPTLFCVIGTAIAPLVLNNFMKEAGPIVIVDDDVEDQEIFEMVFSDLQIEQERKYFTGCTEAFTYLQTVATKPFIVFCDINLPHTNGLEFKKKIDEDEELRAKSIPFVFLSTATEGRSVNTAYRELTIQGFFKKEDTINGLKKTLSLILDYWTVCYHPQV